ncbi:23370_t:CDS:2, partial [Cetraspora pellucida]
LSNNNNQDENTISITLPPLPEEINIDDSSATIKELAQFSNNNELILKFEILILFIMSNAQRNKPVASYVITRIEQTSAELENGT